MSTGRRWDLKDVVLSALRAHSWEVEDETLDGSHVVAVYKAIPDREAMADAVAVDDSSWSWSPPSGSRLRRSLRLLSKAGLVEYVRGRWQRKAEWEWSRDAMRASWGAPLREHFAIRTRLASRDHDSVEAALDRLRLTPRVLADGISVNAEGEIEFREGHFLSEAPFNREVAVHLLALSGSSSHVRRLDLSHCERLSNVDSLASFWGLEHLDLSFCIYLKDLRGLANLRSLRVLDLNRSSLPSDLAPLSTLVGLEVLNLENTFCRDLSFARGLRNLRDLNLRYNRLADLGPISGLASLRSLDISECEGVKSLAPVGDLPSLETLRMSGSAENPDLAPLSNLTTLRRLSFDAWNPRDLPIRSQADALASGYGALGCLSFLGDMPSLSVLRLCGFKALSSWPNPDALASIQELDVAHCGSDFLEGLEVIRGLQRFRVYGASDPAKVLAAPAISRVRSLSLGGITGACAQFPLDSVLSLKELRRIEIEDSGPFDCTPLHELGHLEVVDLSRCWSPVGAQDLADSLSPGCEVIFSDFPGGAAT